MKKTRVKWGFIWIVIASVLWGISYVPKEAIWFVEPLGTLWENGGSDLFEGTIVVSALQALVFAVVLFFLWSCINNKPREVYRNFVTWPISKWFLVSAFFGGMMAMFGSTVATAYVGAGYASAIALLSAVVGAVYGRFMLNEKMTLATVAGILVLMIGGILVLNPVEMVHDMMNPDAKSGVMIGYIGGILSAVGWGIESCYNVRGLDLADSEASTPVRYGWECILWFVIVFPLTAATVGFDNFNSLVLECLTSTDIMCILLFTALSLGIADSLLHKGYSMMGAGRGLAINAIYAPVSLVALWVFLKDYNISIWLAIGSVIAVAGTFIMYWEKEEIVDTIRDVEQV